MKKFIIFVIDIYQKFLSYLLKNIFGVSYFCRFRPTCSQYAKEALEKEGVFLGGYRSFARILKCQPFCKTQSI